MACTVWLTGLPGAGKTTLLAALGDELRSRGVPVEKLDSDYIAEGFVKHLGVGTVDRKTRTLFLGFAASRLNRHGVTCVAAATTPRAATRAELRDLIEDFVEVFVRCPLEIAQERDPKNLYAMARAGVIPDFPGVGAPYEEPVSPEIVVDAGSASVEECVSKICEYLIDRGHVTP